MAIKVLLVDDERSFVETLGRRLTLRQFVVHQAYDADTAMTVLADNPDIDVVVLDVKMPGTDGLTAIKSIKRRHPLIEVILLSGHANLEASVGGMALGAFDYLLKPVASYHTGHMLLQHSIEVTATAADSNLFGEPWPPEWAAARPRWPTWR